MGVEGITGAHKTQKYDISLVESKWLLNTMKKLSGQARSKCCRP